VIVLLLGFCFGGFELSCWERWELFSQGLRLDFVRDEICWAGHVDVGFFKLGFCLKVNFWGPDLESSFMVLVI